MADERQHPDSPPYDPYGAEVELIDYLRVLWRRRGLIVAGTFLCGLGAVLYSFLAPPLYEATVTLMVTEPKIGEATPLPASVPTFRGVIASRALAVQVVEEFGLDRPPHQLEPLAFLERALEVETIRDTILLNATVRLGDPELAAAVANRLAELAVERNKELNQSQTIEIRDFIKAQLDEARERMEQLEPELLAYKRDAQIEVLKAETDSLLGQKRQLLDLLIKIESERARLAKAEEELARREKILTVRRAIDRDTAMMEAARGTDSDPDLLSLELRDEFLNPVYNVLEREIATTRTELAFLEERRDQLVQELNLDGPALDELAELYRREIELANLQAEYGLAKRIYMDFAARYEEARIQVASRSAQLQVLDPALPPERPTSPRTLLNVVLALIVGLMLTTMAAFFIEYISTAEGSRG